MVAHAGEEGPASYVREAVELLHVDRIDHGTFFYKAVKTVKVTIGGCGAGFN